MKHSTVEPGLGILDRLSLTCLNSASLKYPVLDFPGRKQVWLNFFEFANIKGKDLNADELSDYELNGRQIRTSLR
jgi:hypothetical protein